MSGTGARRERPKEDGSWLKTGLTFAAGALAGAGIAAAAYFAATEEDRPHSSRTQQHTQQSRGLDRTDSYEEEKVLGVVKVCEICFENFDELKARDIHIVTTPCGHVFCRVCIEEALARKEECPHCRRNVGLSQLQRLFL